MVFRVSVFLEQFSVSLNMPADVHVTVSQKDTSTDGKSQRLLSIMEKNKGTAGTSYTVMLQNAHGNNPWMVAKDRERTD